MEIMFTENGWKSKKEKGAVPDDGLSALRGKSLALFPSGFPFEATARGRTDTTSPGRPLYLHCISLQFALFSLISHSE